MKKIKILFQGDSITDADRDRSDYHKMGYGYAAFVVEKLTAKYPDVDFEFINLGLSGNRTDQLFDRLTHDCVELDPDIVSVLIGINDVWHRYEYEFIPTTDEQIALNFKCILERIKRDSSKAYGAPALHRGRGSGKNAERRRQTRLHSRLCCSKLCRRLRPYKRDHSRR